MPCERVALAVSTKSALIGKFNALPGQARAAFWAVMTAAGFAGVVGMVRYLSADYHPLEIVFFRNLFGLLAMAPWVLRAGPRGLSTSRPGTFLLRAFLSLIAMSTWFMAVSLVPMSQAVTLSFTAPLFATIGAVLILGEKVWFRRWIAVIVGFLGVIIIMRPDTADIPIEAGFALASAAAIAAATLVVKSLSRTESPEAIVVQLGLYVTPMALIPALFVWKTPDLTGLLWLAVTGVIGTFAQICLSRALAAADASAVAPYDYVRLPMVALIGYLFFGEVTDLTTWIGAAVIVGASAYVTRREHVLSRARQRDSEGPRFGAGPM